MATGKRTASRDRAYALHEASVCRLGETSPDAIVGGRLLPVGGCSKDPDARAGRPAGGMGRGHKRHILVNGDYVILAYLIRPMNQAGRA